MGFDRPEIEEVEGFLEIVWRGASFRVKGKKRSTFRVILTSKLEEGDLEAIRPYFEVVKISDHQNKGTYLELRHEGKE